MKEVQYSQVRNDLKTGDLILFSGRGLVSGAIKLMSRSKYSHIGMVIRLEDFDFVALWESAPLKMKDVEKNSPKKGVRLVTLSERIAKFNGDVMLRSLEGYALTDDDKLQLKFLRKRLSDKPYETSFLELFNSAYDGIFGENEDEDLNSLFCSELVAEAYQCLNLLDNAKNSNEYIPGDFEECKNLKLQKGHLGPEVQLICEE